jgi:hypothetical protein
VEVKEEVEDSYAVGEEEEEEEEEEEKEGGDQDAGEHCLADMNPDLELLLERAQAGGAAAFAAAPATPPTLTPAVNLVEPVVHLNDAEVIQPSENQGGDMRMPVEHGSDAAAAAAAAATAAACEAARKLHAELLEIALQAKMGRLSAELAAVNKVGWCSSNIVRPVLKAPGISACMYASSSTRDIRLSRFQSLLSLPACAATTRYRRS